MKIYEIGTGYTPIPAQMGAATEIVVEELTLALRKLGEDVQIIDIASDCRAEHDLPILEVPVPKCFSGTDVKLGLMHKLKRVVYSVSLAFTLRKLLKNSREKVVLHFHNQYNMFFFLHLVPGHLRKKAMTAYTNHSGIWRLPWQEIEQTVRKRYFQEKICMCRSDIVFLLNEQTRDNIVQHLGVSRVKLVLIGNGVNTDRYHPLSDAEKEHAKAKWGLDGCDVILQVGSVNENKGQLRTAEGLLPLLKENPKLVFAYAGGIVDEAYQERVIQLSKDHGLQRQIRYLGMIPPGYELNEIYNTAEMTVFPSVYEAFGLVVIESFSAGVPVLVHRNGMIHLGDGTVEFGYEDLCVLVSEILLRKDAARNEWICVCRNNALRNYSWDKIAGDYLMIFQSEMRNNA